jgi:hypothetical protein
VSGPARERLSATAFVRDYAAHASAGNLAAVSIVLALSLGGTIAIVAGAHGILLWCSVAMAVAWWGLFWWMLGTRPVQNWIRDGHL